MSDYVLSSMSKAKAGAKVAVIEQVAELAMRLGGRHLSDYGATTSRHDFTQRQLMSCLILRAYLGTTYRGLLELLAVSPPLRQRLGLGDKLPHFTTLQKFSNRSQVQAIVQQMLATIGHAAAQAQGTSGSAAAMDSTGLTLSTASDYYRSRQGRHMRKFIKVSVMILCGSLLPLGLAVGLGPTHDRLSVPELLAQAQAVARPEALYADAGYDAEWIHKACREQWQVASFIPPVTRRADGKWGGKWRSQMNAEYLQANGYGRRWGVESFFSGLKRTTGSTLRARLPKQLLAEASLKVLAYTLRR
jgi:Transposase DDE domain/Transposase domain (DUF772)